MSYRSALAMLAFVPVVTACHYFMMGDGMFIVTGRLSQAADGCEVLLLSSSGALLPYSPRPIHGQEFRVDFVVAPYSAQYEVVVKCQGIVHKSATVRYGTEVQGGQTVSLGNIAL